MEAKNINIGLVKFIYGYTALFAGLCGITMIVAPPFFNRLYGIPPQDPYIYGVAASIWSAFGILALLGMRDPVKFIPVLLIQVTYKSIWLAVIVAPEMIKGNVTLFGVVAGIIMLSFVILDAVALPFSLLLDKNEKLI